MVDAGIMPLMTALISAVAIAATAYAVMYPMISGDREKERRVASVTVSRAKSVSARTAADLAASRKKQIAESLKEMESRSKAKEKISLRLRLERAGLAVEPRMYWIASVVAAIVIVMMVRYMLPGSMAPIKPMVTVAALIVGGLGLPRFVLKQLIARRQAKFVAELANAIDVIVRGIKSGLPLNDCLGVIARESAQPLGDEFKEVVDQQRLGVPLSEALDRLAQRMPLPEVKFLAIVIAIQQQSGGNLAEALSNLSTVLRERHKMAMKVKALSAEAKASAAILACLPPGVMIMVNMSSPDYIAPLFTTRTGNFLVLIGLFWMAMGILVMRKMINFKF